MQCERKKAASGANAEDASIWRWFSGLREERRIKWRCSFNSWIILVERKQLAAGSSSDGADLTGEEGG